MKIHHFNDTLGLSGEGKSTATGEARGDEGEERDWHAREATYIMQMPPSSPLPLPMDLASHERLPPAAAAADLMSHLTGLYGV